MHIAKAGGQWLREALTNAVGTDNACPLVFEPDFRNAAKDHIESFQLVSGHFGSDFALSVPGCRVVVFRNPIDRILSLYSYFRGLSDADFPAGGQRDTALEMSLTMDLSHFLRSNEAPVLSDFHNAQVWQMASSHLWTERQKLIGISDEKLLELAQENLVHFDIVGVSEAMSSVVEKIRSRTGLGIAPYDGRRNASKREDLLSILPSAIRETIHSYTYLDRALYDFVISRYILAEETSLDRRRDQ